MIAIVVEDQGVTVEVAPKTIRSQMSQTSLYRKIDEWQGTIAEDLGYDTDLILGPLMDYVVLSVRCIVVEGELDFTFLPHACTLESMSAGFAAYIDSQQEGIRTKITETVNLLDAPDNSDFTRGALPETAEKKD